MIVNQATIKTLDLSDEFAKKNCMQEIAYLKRY